MQIPTTYIDQTSDALLAVYTKNYSARVVAVVKALPGAKWDGVGKRWMVPHGQLQAVVRGLAGLPVVVGPTVRFDSAPVPPSDPAPAPSTYAETLATIEATYTFKTPPFGHQKPAMALAVQSKRFALLMEMGTGKTKSAIDYVSYLMQIGHIGGALILCPKAVMLNWEREIAVHSPLPPDVRRVAVLRGSGDAKSEMLDASKHVCNFFVTNYQTLLADLPLFALVKGKRLAIVLDESTYIKTHSSKMAKAAKTLGMATAYKLILSGTPYTQGPLDAFSQFGFLDPTILGHHNFYSFKAEYAITGGFKGKEIVGYKNLERLNKRLAPHSYRVLKQDCLDLPDKLYRTIEVEMGPKQAAAYKSMKEESIVQLEGVTVSAPIVLTRMLRLQQITSGYLPVQDEFGMDAGLKLFENPKIEALVEVVEEAVSQGRKVIVWSRFVHDVQGAVEALRGRQIGIVEYHGGVSDIDRQKAVDSMQNDPAVSVFVGQVQTGGIGITLTAASVEVYLSNTFTLADRLQSEDRAHRIGQKRKVDIIDIGCRGTVDGYVLKVLKSKKNVADVITGDNLREVLGDG